MFFSQEQTRFPSPLARDIRKRLFCHETKEAFSWSECRDSNSRPLEPHSSAIPNFATPGYAIQLCYYSTANRKKQGEILKIFIFFRKRAETKEKRFPFFTFSAKSGILILYEKQKAALPAGTEGIGRLCSSCGTEAFTKKRWC